MKRRGPFNRALRSLVPMATIAAATISKDWWLSAIFLLIAVALAWLHEKENEL